MRRRDAAQTFGDKQRRTRGEDGDESADILLLNGQTAAGLYACDGLSLAVQPDAAAGLSADAVHGVGVVEGEGVGSILHEVQRLCDFAGDEVDAFRGSQVSLLLLVAFRPAMDAGKNTADSGRGLSPKLKQQSAGFVRRKEESGRVRRKAGRPVCQKRDGKQEQRRQDKEGEQRFHGRGHGGFFLRSFRFFPYRGKGWTRQGRDQPRAVCNKAVEFWQYVRKVPSPCSVRGSAAGVGSLTFASSRQPSSIRKTVLPRSLRVWAENASPPSSYPEPLN